MGRTHNCGRCSPTRDRKIRLSRPGLRAKSDRPAGDTPERGLDRLAHSVALVTGAGRGIGRDTALALAAAGAVVVVGDVDEAAGDEVAGEIRARGGTAVALAVDVSDEPRVMSLAELISGSYGRVNNAGLVHVDAVLETPLDVWRRVFRVNADRTLLVTQATVRLMRRQPPHPALARRAIVLNISSLASESPRPHKRRVRREQGVDEFTVEDVRRSVRV